ncbi:hypothetical protein JCM1841_001685 [Sporobolomyces salmonicolor]
MAFLFHGYVSLLQRYTLPTQMATGGVTSGIGDLIYQKGLEDKRWSEVEWYKTRRLVFYGSCCFAPIANRWHFLLNKIQVGGKWSTIAARTATDLSIFSPFATCLFYLCQGTFESRPWRTHPSAPETQGIFERLQERLWPTVQKQWAVFGPAQLVNLTVMPVYARPPLMNVVSIGWSAFLASAQSRGGIPPPELLLKNGPPAIVVAAEVME